jgi:hypothetical protein
MTAYLVLASIGLLLALLVHGRLAPTILFTSLAALYYLTGLVDQGAWLSSYTNAPLAILVMLLLVSLVLERSPVLDHVSGALLRGHQGWAIFRFASVTSLFRPS